MSGIAIEAKKELARQRASAWYYANPERAKATRRAYAAGRKAETAEYNRTWRSENAEKLREYERKRSTTEERKKSGAEWRAKNSRRIVERVQRWQTANPEKARALAAQTAHRRRARARATVDEPIDLFRFRVMAEPICGICGGELYKQKAEIDHVIPLSRGGGHVHGNLQLTHRSCNRRKGNRLQGVIYSI